MCRPQKIVTSKPWGRLRQIFVAFSENLNFNKSHYWSLGIKPSENVFFGSQLFSKPNQSQIIADPQCNYDTLEIKPCGLGSRIRDVEAFWYKTEIKMIYFVPLCLIVPDCMVYPDPKKYQKLKIKNLGSWYS